MEGVNRSINQGKKELTASLCMYKDMNRGPKPITLASENNTCMEDNT